MSTATIGSRYQVVIPAEERAKIGLKPHDKVTVEIENGTIIIRPLGAQSYRGIGYGLGRGKRAVDYVRDLRAEWELEQ
ncbi:MAG: AbrB/MazE/SpoVT family DNA-binding domain-containing protein [Verrucomicrobia bacterium]|nr:AbrB/MazE/SpoVT family DNA-binding domain-containing protein [Verrucomicrobiota bacterium]